MDSGFQESCFRHDRLLGFPSGSTGSGPYPAGGIAPDDACLSACVRHSSLFTFLRVQRYTCISPRLGGWGPWSFLLSSQPGRLGVRCGLDLPCHLKGPFMNMINRVVLARGDTDSSVNQWFNEHPLVLGLMFMLIGAALAGSGVYELRKGVAHDKYGNEIHGGLGSAISMFRIVAGVVCCGFGVYKMAAG